MNKFMLLTAARLSAGGLLAALITACGSGGSKNPGQPTASSAPVISSTAAVSSSSVAVSSSSKTSSSAAVNSSSMASSSVAPAVVATSCDVPNGTYTECLDFESVAPGAVPAGFNLTGTGVVVVEGEGSHSGNLALKATSTNQSAGFLTLNNFTGTHWGRLFYKNTVRPASLSTHTHTTLVAATQNSAQFRFVDMVAAPNHSAEAGFYQHLYNTEPNDLSLEGPYNNTHNNQWVCMEWSMNTAAQEFRLFKDGAEITLKNFGVASNATNMTAAKKYDFDKTKQTFAMTPVPDNLTLKIGIQTYQMGLTYTFLMDDIAFGDTRIGCAIPVQGAVSSAMSSSSSTPSNSSISSSSAMSSSSMPASSSSVASSSSAPEVIVGKAEYDAKCVGCHANPSSLKGSRNLATLTTYIDANMPKGNPSACKDTCASNTASYILR